MKYLAAVYSAKGIREKNEDSFIADTFINSEASPFTEKLLSGNCDSFAFFGVADGMGGQGFGEKASHLVVSELLKYCKNTDFCDYNNLSDRLNSIHEKLISSGTKMGSTLSAIIYQSGKSGIVNLGDSRVYRLRKGIFMQMTNDDSLQRYIPGSPKNIITNGLGAGLSSISVNSRFSENMLLDGDIFVACCDGISGFLSEENLEQILKNNNISDAASTIVTTALKNGSDDNCTVVVVKFEE